MFKELFDTKEEVEEKTAFMLNFDCHVDSDGEVYFSYTVYYGMGVWFDGNKILNACDHKTNVSGLKKLLEEIKERCLKNETTKT